MTKHPLFQTLADINRLRDVQRPLFELVVDDNYLGRLTTTMLAG
ncbi:hypothetical protein os1_02660 [Comamonadaceae bacterium OS-1]|nr:hypothetical protein os1_02660 [Comamonadaceae bacterium OS-1]